MKSSAAFVPSCGAGGAFSPKQCQPGGQCWCVDPTGRELPGTRQHGDALNCSESGHFHICSHHVLRLPLRTPAVGWSWSGDELVKPTKMQESKSRENIHIPRWTDMFD